VYAPVVRALLITVAVAGFGCKPHSAPVAGNADGGMGATLVSCGAGCVEPPGKPKDGGVLRVHIDAEPATLCDLVEHDAWGRWIMENQVQETLIFQEPWSGALGARLAERWKLDGNKLTLQLRRGVRWHDGKPFTAADVVFTLRAAKDPANGADQAADLAAVKSVDATDDATVVLTLGGAAPYLLQALAHISILPAHAYAGQSLRTAPASRAPVGTGPFRFDRWDTGKLLRITRNADYWGPRAHLDAVEFVVARDKNVALELWKRGELDVLFRLPSPRVADELAHDPARTGARLLAWTPRAYYFVVWNTTRPSLSKPEVRRALGQLIDRKRFMQVAFAGHARPVTGPYAPESSSYDPSVTAPEFDPKAASALKELSGTKLKFLATAGSRSVEQLATLFKEELAKAGITLEIETVDFATLLARLRDHSFDISALQWTVSLEQDNYNMFHSSQSKGGQNYGAFSDGDADALMVKIRNTADDEARHNLDRALHRRLAELQPYAFLCSPEAQTLLARRVHGLRPSADGLTFAEAWIE
jgi:peptide/nickel transport system substrate-binding protein